MAWCDKNGREEWRFDIEERLEEEEEEEEVWSSLLGERIEDWQLYVIPRWRGEGVVEEEGLGEVLEAKGRWSLKC